MSVNPSQSINGEQLKITQESEEAMEYEKSREQRIKENLKRMEKLGIVDLSLQLKSLHPPRRTLKKTPHTSSPLHPSDPPRRSSRLQNVTPVSYSEVPLTKKDSSLENDEILLEKGSKPEIYTEEHEKLLGSTGMSWTLFVDGYGKDGRRIYDPIKGKTCHQCRQKTLGHRTHCSKCQMVQGQFCGDCLYMRYGEHVLEANQNPDWICPVCRGICNCSLCRSAKGWPPTGPLYKRVMKLGFRSVAHYLIQTKMQLSANTPQSAKRSLAFAEMEAPREMKEPCKCHDDQHGIILEFKEKEPREFEEVVQEIDEMCVNGGNGLRVDNEDNGTDELREEKCGEEPFPTESANIVAQSEGKAGPNSKNDKEIALAAEPSSGNVAGRLRKKCKKGNVEGIEEMPENNDNKHAKEDAKLSTSVETTQKKIMDRTARRLRPRHSKTGTFNRY
ncbi:hypothetical protein Nepgr_026457 [Nepenthes gracilis]|uniref:Zinc-finger domain-containing protein n=1 Tax=Nepenthes gracilis TaxID=150966 RepID=A0AAD3Y236_NEPGR|nr:hypothetical protein Nepgr_026457 [Nepenthes gracilis]